MARHTISAEQKETGAPADKLPKVDKPTSTPPTIADAKSATVTESPKTKESAANTESSTIASPPKPKKFITKSAPPLKPTSDTSTKREIDTYFEHHFHPARVFLSPGNKKYPGTAPDYNISSSILVSILSNLSPAALQQFQDEYLNDVYVFIDRLDQFKEFAGVALRFPKVGGRIKLDSRKVCEPERERMPLVLDSPEQQEKLREKIEKLDVWKEEVRKVVLLVGEEMGLDEAALNEKLSSITPLPPKRKEPLVEVDMRKWINPVAQDLKVLKYKEGGWSVTISCDSVLAGEEKQTFQLWGDIGGLNELWKYYESSKEDTNAQSDVEKVEV